MSTAIKQPNMQAHQRWQEHMIEELRKQIEDSYYWDARVTALECNYYGDEVKLAYEDNDGEIVYQFEECYKIQIEHPVEWPKDIPFKNLKVTQIPYFMQDVEVNEIILRDKNFLEFKINMHPIELYIVCKKFNIIGV